MDSRKNSNAGEGVGKRIVKIASKVVDVAVVAVLALLFILGCYALWDSNQVNEQANAIQWQPYKPTEPEPLSFWELQRINPEVVGWLSVYGTNIDYPMCASSNVEKYLDTNAKGEHALSGALFLDPKCAGDFSGFSTIVYGHHMAHEVMFGQISDFADAAFFEEHRYGQLFDAHRDWGLEFICYLDADAYDGEVYRTSFGDAAHKQAYLDLLMSRAKCKRDVAVGPQDRIVLLSTCSSESTNGRSILVGKLCDEVFENTFVDWPNTGTGIDDVPRLLGIPWYAWVAVIAWIALIAALVWALKRRKKKGPQKTDETR